MGCHSFEDGVHGEVENLMVHIDQGEVEVLHWGLKDTDGSQIILRRQGANDS